MIMLTHFSEMIFNPMPYSYWLYLYVCIASMHTSSLYIRSIFTSSPSVYVFNTDENKMVVDQIAGQFP